MDNYDLGFKDANVKNPKKINDNGTKSVNFVSPQAGHLRHLKMQNGEKCEYAASRADVLKTHMITHSREKSNKCNQCDYASSRADNLRTHLKTHTGEKPQKCSHCDFACSDPSSLRRHLKHTVEKNH